MTANGRGIVVIGLGNTYRRDDGAGVAVAAELDDLALPNICVLNGITEPMGLLEAWSGARLAMVVDAAIAAPSAPGRVRRCTLDDLAVTRDGLSSHGVDIRRTHALGQELGRVPDALVVFTVEVADTGYGVGLSPQVARAVPEAVQLMLDEINCGGTNIEKMG